MKQTVIYQGLFLIAFALYANERNQAHPTFFQKEVAPAITPGEIPKVPELRGNLASDFRSSWKYFVRRR
jgi:hypothetical protein